MSTLSAVITTGYTADRARAGPPRAAKIRHTVFGTSVTKRHMNGKEVV
ncbi:hypothetical protein [Dactylosporangium sp. NPDC049140]